MLEKLDAIKRRWENVEQQLSDPKVVADMKLFTKLKKEYKDLKEIVDASEEYKKVLNNIASAKEVLNTEKDEDFREMAKVELEENEKLQEEL